METNHQDGLWWDLSIQKMNEYEDVIQMPVLKVTYHILHIAQTYFLQLFWDYLLLYSL